VTSEIPEGGPEPADPTEVTALLAAARAGDRGAFDRVVAMVYGELRRLASRQVRGYAGQTLSTTALVHEAYVRLAGSAAMGANDRTHLFALAARAMRQILIDHLRRGGRRKRGGDVRRISLSGVEEARIPGGDTPDAAELLALDRALERLSAVDPELERLVEWRFFAGLTLTEIAGLTGTSERTLKRDWAVARVFLLREMGGSQPPPAGGA
jgi:RNA polymerase sigma factor (TIGR02999 family)